MSIGNKAEEQEARLDAIMERVKPGGRPSCFKLWFCRHRSSTCKSHLRVSKHCADCILGKENETLGEIYDRIERGDLQ